MASIRLKHRANFFATTGKGVFYKRIIYGRNMEDLQAQINEIGKTERIEGVKYFKLTNKNIWEAE